MRPAFEPRRRRVFYYRAGGTAVSQRARRAKAALLGQLSGLSALSFLPHPIPHPLRPLTVPPLPNQNPTNSSFHLNKKTGEVTRIVDRGTSAIQNVLSTIVFSIAPQVVGRGGGGLGSRPLCLLSGARTHNSASRLPQTPQPLRAPQLLLAVWSRRHPFFRHPQPPCLTRAVTPVPSPAQIIDMLAAATYLAGSLEPTIAAITFVTIGSYIPLTVGLS